MAHTPSAKSWNNFIFSTGPSDIADDEKRAAWIAKQFMNGVRSGGINSFLTNNWELDAQSVVEALKLVGAATAAGDLASVLNQLGTPLPAASQDQRWLDLDCWPESLDQADCLSAGAAKELMKRLEEHVAKHQKFYAEIN